MGYWKRLAGEYLETHGVLNPPKDILEKIKPMTMTESAALFIREFGLQGTPEQVADDMNAMMDEHYRSDIPLKAGVKEYLTRLRDRGVRMCVASATAEPLMEACLSRLGVRGDFASENFVSEQDSRFYADMYRKSGIKGGHIILLNSVDSEYYEDTKEQAVMALEAYPQGLQVGGGITADNAMEFIDAGATAVIVTSYVFKDGRINYANLNRLKDTVGSDRLVIDLSCRKKDGQYYIVTDRWQNFTDEAVTTELLDKLSSYCCEFLVHAVDVEGRVNGIEKELVAMLGSWGRIPVTYAGGVSSFDDLKCIRQLGQNHLNVTIGSALDLFGGEMEYDKVIAFCNNKEI